MVDFNNLRDVAERLITANGRDVTLVRRNRTPDPGAPTMPWRGPVDPPVGGDDTSTVVKAVFIEFEEEDTPPTLVSRGEKSVLVAAKTLEAASPAIPNVEDYNYLLDGTAKWTIERVEIIEPGPSRVLYQFMVRQ